jgi:hypothetical protein
LFVQDTLKLSNVSDISKLSNFPKLFKSNYRHHFGPSIHMYTGPLVALLCCSCRSIQRHSLTILLMPLIVLLMPLNRQFKIHADVACIHAITNSKRKQIIILLIASASFSHGTVEATVTQLGRKRQNGRENGFLTWIALAAAPAGLWGLMGAT